MMRDPELAKAPTTLVLTPTLYPYQPVPTVPILSTLTKPAKPSCKAPSRSKFSSPPMGASRKFESFEELASVSMTAPCNPSVPGNSYPRATPPDAPFLLGSPSKRSSDFSNSSNSSSALSPHDNREGVFTFLCVGRLQSYPALQSRLHSPLSLLSRTTGCLIGMREIRQPRRRNRFHRIGRKQQYTHAGKFMGLAERPPLALPKI